MRGVAKSFAILYTPILAFLLSSCGQSSLSWTEEIKLQSGEVIVVQRTAKTKDFGEVGGPGGWENEGMTLEILKPKKPDNPVKWDFPFVPLIYDYDAQNKEWFVVATFYSCKSWYALGKPSLPYTEFRLKGDHWVMQPLTPALIGREGNVLTTISKKGEPNHTLESKAKINANPAIDQSYKHVVAKWRGC